MARRSDYFLVLGSLLGICPSWCIEIETLLLNWSPKTLILNTFTGHARSSITKIQTTLQSEVIKESIDRKAELWETGKSGRVSLNRGISCCFTHEHGIHDIMEGFIHEGMTTIEAIVRVRGDETEKIECYTHGHFNFYLVRDIFEAFWIECSLVETQESAKFYGAYHFVE